MDNQTGPLIERANLLLAQGRYADAEKFIQQALALEPDNDYALSVLARCYLNKGEYDKGIETIQQAIANNAEESFYYYLLGFGHYRKSESQAAITFLNTAIEINPYYAEYYGLLAIVHLDENHFELALKKADEGLAVDAENITCLNARSTALNKLRRTDDAIATMQDALAKDPDNEFTHSTIGWNFLEKGKHKLASSHFREALRIDPDHHRAKIGLKEALKSRIPPYRWLLQLSFWLRNKGKSFRWGFFIAIYVGVRIIVTISKESPGFENIGLVIAGCYILFVATSWIINPLANCFLLFHKDGRYALDQSEKNNAMAFMICIAAGIVIMLLSTLTADKDRAGDIIASGLIALSLCIPAGHMTFPIRFKGNSFSQWIAISLLAVGCISILIALAGLPSPEIFFVIYFLLFVVYTWSKAF